MHLEELKKNSKIMKVTIRSETCKNIYDNSSYLLSFGNEKWQSLQISFNPLQPGVAFLYPLKTSNPEGFLGFSGGIEKQHQTVMG